MHKVFISYHHQNDEYYKKQLVSFGEQHSIFIDRSIDTGDISEDLPDERIREIIRDDYLRDSTVTIVLVGAETKGRKHIDWEIYSSMHDGLINKKSGILVITLPTVSSGDEAINAAHGEQHLYPDIHRWISLNSRAEWEKRYPYMPERLIDNLCKPEAKISVTPWQRIVNNSVLLRGLVDLTYNARSGCKYDLRRPMRKHNSYQRRVPSLPQWEGLIMPGGSNHIKPPQGTQRDRLPLGVTLGGSNHIKPPQGTQRDRLPPGVTLGGSNHIKPPQGTQRDRLPLGVTLGGSNHIKPPQGTQRDRLPFPVMLGGLNYIKPPQGTQRDRLPFPVMLGGLNYIKPPQGTQRDRLPPGVTLGGSNHKKLSQGTQRDRLPFPVMLGGLNYIKPPRGT